MGEFVSELKQELNKKDIKGLVVCEKPSQAKAVREAYMAMKNKPCQLDFLALHGHIMKMIEPAEYTSDWGKPWRKEVLPMIPKKFQYKVDDNSVKTFEELKKALRSGGYDFICNGCDADREGEAIFWNPVSFLGWKGPVYRLWNHDATAEAYQKALNALIRYEKGSDLNNLRNASVFRGMMDWEVGMSGSRAVAMATRVKLPNNQAVAIGRVKTPVVAMVVARDEQIANFASAKYYEIIAEYPGFSAKWFSEDATNVESKDRADKIVAVSGLKGTVTEKTVTRKKTQPPQLYSLSELQKAASRKYGMTAQKVLDTVQALYEAKYVSYPRTDARVLSTDKVTDVPKMLSAVAGIPELSASVKLIRNETSRIDNAAKDKRYFDNQKITAHHALVPTTQKADMSSMTGDQKKIYMMIVRQFVGIFLDAYEYDETVVVVEMGGGQTYKTTSQKPVKPGWKAAMDTDKEQADDESEKSDEAEQDLSSVTKGSSITATNVKAVEKKTKAPAKYTDASLISDMTNCAKFATDPKIKAALKEKGGLGTEATRAALIEDCIKKGLLARSGKHIVATEAAIALTHAMAGVDLVSPDLTAVWEMKLLDVESGAMSSDEFKTHMESYVRGLTSKLLELPDMSAAALPEIGKCPICGGKVVEMPKTFSCEHNKKDSPCFVVFKQMSGAKITAADVKCILSGKTTKVKTFISQKTGKPFDAALRLEDKKVVFDFSAKDESQKDDQSKTKASKTSVSTDKSTNVDRSVSEKRCPCCGAAIKRVRGYIFCERHTSKEDSECPFFFSVKFEDQTLKEEDIEKLLNGQATDYYEFTSRRSGMLDRKRLKIVNGQLAFLK